MNNISNIELEKIKSQYKFTIDQKEEIKQVREQMLTKYKNVWLNEKMVNHKQ